MRLFLNEQDLDILHHIARGKRIGEIALLIGLTESGIKQRLKPLLTIFGALTLPHLMAICIASGVVDVPELSEDFDIHVKEYRRYPGKRNSYNLRAVRDSPYEMVK